MLHTMIELCPFDPNMVPKSFTAQSTRHPSSSNQNWPVKTHKVIASLWYHFSLPCLTS